MKTFLTSFIFLKFTLFYVALLHLLFMFVPIENARISENEIDPNNRHLVPNENDKREASDANVGDFESLFGFEEVDLDVSTHTPSEHFHNHSHHDGHDVIHVASWQWEYVRTPFIYTAVVIVAGFCKIGQ